MDKISIKRVILLMAVLLLLALFTNSGYTTSDSNWIFYNKGAGAAFRSYQYFVTVGPSDSYVSVGPDDAYVYVKGATP